METERVGVFPGVSYSTEADGERVVSLFERPGESGDEYGGWVEQEKHLVERIELPDGETPPPAQSDFLGEEQDALFEVEASGSLLEITEVKREI